MQRKRSVWAAGPWLAATLLAAALLAKLLQHLLPNECRWEIDIEWFVAFVLDQHVSAERILRNHPHLK